MVQWDNLLAIFAVVNVHIRAALFQCNLVKTMCTTIMYYLKSLCNVFFTLEYLFIINSCIQTEECSRPIHNYSPQA